MNLHLRVKKIVPDASIKEWKHSAPKHTSYTPFGLFSFFFFLLFDVRRLLLKISGSAYVLSHTKWNFKIYSDTQNTRKYRWIHLTCHIRWYTSNLLVSLAEVRQFVRYNNNFEYCWNQTSMCLNDTTNSNVQNYRTLANWNQSRTWNVAVNIEGTCHSSLGHTLTCCLNLVKYRFKNMLRKESLIRSSTVI